MTCEHARLKTHTFSNGDTMSRCPDCNYGVGHCDQSPPSGDLLYSKGGKAVIEEPEEYEDVQPELSELQPPSFSALFDEQAEELQDIEEKSEEDGATDSNSPAKEESGSCV